MGGSQSSPHKPAKQIKRVYVSYLEVRDLSPPLSPEAKNRLIQRIRQDQVFCSGNQSHHLSMDRYSSLGKRSSVCATELDHNNRRSSIIENV